MTSEITFKISFS